MSSRIQPNHCPYCGDVNLWPHLPEGAPEGTAAAWECRSCLRAFTTQMLGMINRPEANS